MRKSKSQFQDIIPQEKRSIRNIPLSNHAEVVIKPDQSIKGRFSDEEISVEKELPSKFKEISYKDDLVFTGGRRVGGLSKLTLWIITLACASALFLSLTYFFTAAVVKVDTKELIIPLPASMNLSLSPKEGEIAYSTVSFTDSVSELVDATGEKDVLSKATGNIMVYNAFDSNSQKFVEGTRFETPGGLIYKTSKAIIVPGKKTVSGKEVPGSIEVSVVAEKAGPEYNIELTDFTVPGLKNDSRFNKFYARSKTSMTGGESGKVAEVSEVDMTKVVGALKEKLETNLKEKLEKELPKNQVLLKDLSVLNFKVSSPKLKDGKALVEVEGNIKAYVLDSNSLARFLLRDSDTPIKESDSFVVVLDEVVASVDDLTNMSSVNFSGQAKVSYVFPIDEFKIKIAGVSEDSIPVISKEYSAISEISTTIKPFWKSTIPKDTDRIFIEEI